MIYVDKGLTSGLIVVDVDPLQLKVGISMVSTGGVNAVLVRDHFPEFGTDLENEREWEEGGAAMRWPKRSKLQAVDSHEAGKTAIVRVKKLK